MIRVSKHILFFATLGLIFATLVESESGVVRIRPSGGLNTIADDFTIPPEDARVAHNIDFSANIGGITVRKGFDSVSAISTDWDSLVSIYGAYYSDGSQQLFAVADSTGVGYGSVLVTPKGSARIDSATVAVNDWSIQNKTSFATAQGRVFGVNGQQRGFVWSGNIAQRWPLPSPGEPTITPIPCSSPVANRLNGEFRYVILANKWFRGGGNVLPQYPIIFGTNSKSFGTISPPIIVKNGHVILKDFVFPVADLIADSIDSAEIYICRTNANSSPLDASDSLFFLLGGSGYGVIHSIGRTFDSFRVGSSSTVQKFIIDSMAEISTAYYAQPVIDGLKVGRTKYLDSSRFGYSTRRYGAPTYLSEVDSSYISLSNDSTHVSGLSIGIPRRYDLAGWAYAVSLVDTINAIESDTTRSLFVLDTMKEGMSGAKPHKITIGLPKVSSSTGNVMKNIYRAPVWTMKHDTMIRLTIEPLLAVAKGSPIVYWKKRQIYDSLVTGPYYHVGTVPMGDTAFADSIRYDSLVTKDRFRYTTPPLFSSIFSFDGRLYGISGSKLYFSVLDTVSRWGALDFISVNPDDGDVITTAFPSRGVIRVLKNRSNYNIFQGADLGWNRTEVSGYFGCIAPNSHVATINGHYYVSDIGVIRETEGANLERTQSIENVSAKLKQFADFSVSDAKKINATSLPSEGKVLFSKGDTTYVYDERTNTWATWDGVTFTDATLYGAETNADFLPGDSMYFIKSGSRTLFRYGNTTQSLSWVYESAPFGLESPSSKQVSAIGVWASGISAPFGVQATLKDETGATVTTPYVDFGTAIDGYTKFSFPPDYNSKSLYHRLRVAGVGTGLFRAFDIYQHDIGEVEER